jgi:hypothetical protein
MRPIAVLCFTSIAFAQGTQPKPKAEDYEVSATAKAFRIGAEYMVHSFGGQGKLYILENYLVVEVGVYPVEKDGNVTVNPSAFRLRVDGKKPILSPDPPSTAAAAFRRQGSTLSKILGAAASGVGGGMGGPPGTRGPDPQPRAPDPGSPGGIPRAEPDDAAELLTVVAMPTGAYPGAVAGFLYFPYRGKPGKIQTLELLYEDSLLKLR